MTNSPSLVIGVDVGGTNTDSVLLDLSSIANQNRGVLAWNKTETTADVSIGISKAISQLFEKCPDLHKKQISAVIIGTTHFVNAVVERDQNRLTKVAALRLCTNYSKSIPPFVDIPHSLEQIMNGYIGYAKGGFHVDGQPIADIDEEEIIQHCRKINDLGIKSVVVSGIFSNLNPANELAAKTIIERHIPGVNVILSHKVAGIGFLERENASILNASITLFARYTITSFQQAVRDFGMECPVLLTQNDGTVLTAVEAMEVPIRTFSSGPTNSMRGAAFLCRDDPDLKGRSALVVDIGGTTSDVGELMSNGFPRLCSSYSIVGGVRMNFSMPYVESIGLGGGSIVRQHKENSVTVGPDSVGTNIIQDGILFGGTTATASDIVVAANSDMKWGEYLGDPTLLHNKFSSQLLAKAQAEIKTMLETLIDKMKSSADPIPVILVGGGSFLSPEELNGASKVIRVPFHHVANAIGAAIGKISTTINEIKTIEPGVDDREKIINDVIARAKQQSFAIGCVASSATVADLFVDKVNYTPNSYQIAVKVVGDVDYHRIAEAYKISVPDQNKSTSVTYGTFEKNSLYKEVDEEIYKKLDIINYRPHISTKREWIISETDLDFITLGTYILGAGGGGHPYPEYLEVRSQLRRGCTIRVIDPDDLSNHISGEGSIVSCGFAGSPTVTREQMAGSELMNAYKILAQYMQHDADGVMPLEIGGGNGLVALYLASDANLGIPAVDADLMGRAYPTGWQVIPYVYDENHCLAPCGVSDGNGNDLLLTHAENEKKAEDIVRVFLSSVGASVGTVNKPMTADFVQKYTIKRSTSLAWRIGKAIRLCQQKNDIAGLDNAIIDSFGGPISAKNVFSGKIVDVQRSLYNGHVYGEVIIRNAESGKKISISFKNENIAAEVLNEDGTRELLCCVPDLISVVDSDIGEAVGTPEYRYGLEVFVLAIAPNNKWTDTERGIEIGGPKSFGFDHMEYKPVGLFVEPRSVIEEYAS